MNSAGFIRTFAGSFINTGNVIFVKSFPISYLIKLKIIDIFISLANGIPILILSQSVTIISLNSSFYSHNIYLLFYKNLTGLALILISFYYIGCIL
jgi:hypothetical protein